ncbi:hypothetical protein EJB05_39433, partial [Eragrostis curvula]
MSSSESRRRGRERDEPHAHDAAAKRPRRRQKHLYLIMDDWNMGYSIHKLDVDAMEPDASSEKPSLPEPAALRIAAPEDRSTAYFAALGGRILFLPDRYIDEDPILIYDTETASLAVGPRPTPALLPLGHIFFAEINGRLYALNPRRADQECSFEVVSLVPRDVEEHDPLCRRADRWAVESVPAPMPFHRHDLTMFREELDRHVGTPGATLTYMGGSRFCLVECAAREGVTAEDAINGELDGCVLHVTVFHIKYDKSGGLHTTARPSRSYVVS